MELYVDLEKAVLNTGKLVKKRVMVRGKNGKVYYRMQWVDPKTGKPADAHTVTTEPVAEKGASAKHDVSTQKGFIDHHVSKNMSREEKYAHLAKHGVDWKHNDHPAIDHKNAMMALKEHLYKNPHLAGAEHLPKDVDPLKTPDGGHSVDDFSAKYKKHPELLYDMMKHLGVIDKDEVDPRTLDGHQHPSKGGNGKGDIMHMRNMMKFKKMLKEQPGIMDDMMKHDKFGKVHGNSSPKVAEPPVKKDKTPSKAQEGGNTIKGVLNSMSREEIYGLMKHLGIAEVDPALDPSIDAKMRPIHHMRNMMQLKKQIEADPSILNLNTDTGGLSDQEKDRLKGLKGDEKTAEDVKDFLGRASKNLKLQWAGDYADHEHMKNRIKSDHEHVDNMHKTNALKKILTDDPSIMEELKPELEHEELMNIKIGNKDMGKILRQVVGLKGIGDVVAGFDKGKQWEFGVDSTAEITEDDEGEPILSVLDTGKDGEDYNELVFPLKKVKEFLDGLKQGEKVDVVPKDVPLHKKAPQEIWKALNEDFDKNYSDEVGEILKTELGKQYEKKDTTNIRKFISESPIHINHDVMMKLMDKWKIGMTFNKAEFSPSDENFKKAFYSHRIDKTKTKNAVDYLISKYGFNDTWLLHESAKHWSDAERMEARKDFISHNIVIDHEDEYDDLEDRKVKLTNHLHTSLSHVPFDLLTDVLSSDCTLNFSKKGASGKDHIGNYHTKGGIWFDHGYLKDDDSLNAEHPMFAVPKSMEYPASLARADANGNRPRRMFHKFSDTVAHEFAHAIDNYMSGGGYRYMNWGATDEGKKYAGKHVNIVSDSYDSAINRTNPDKFVGESPNKRQKYYFHLDEFMSSYEGRIYNQSTLVKDGRKYKDTTYNPEQKGLEHWSENVSRMANAVHGYQLWREKTGNTADSLDQWAENMHKIHLASGFGDDSTAGDDRFLKSYTDTQFGGNDKDPARTYGYLYHTMKERHPELHQAIKEMLFRPDFLDDKSPGLIQNSEQGDYARKSVDLIINI